MKGKWFGGRLAVGAGLMFAGAWAHDDAQMRVQTFHVPLVTSDITVTNNKGATTATLEAATGDLALAGSLLVKGQGSMADDLTVSDLLKCGRLNVSGRLNAKNDVNVKNDLDVAATTTLRGPVYLENSAIFGERALADTTGPARQLLFSLMFPDLRIMGFVDVIFSADIYNADGVTFFHEEIFTARYAFFKLSAGQTPIVKNVTSVSTLNYYYTEAGILNPNKAYAVTATPDATWIPSSRQVDFYYQPPTDGRRVKNGKVSWAIYSGPAGVGGLWVR